MPAQISPWSALGHPDDRKAIVLFSANEGLSFADLTESSGGFASIHSESQFVYFHMGLEFLDF